MEDVVVDEFLARLANLDSCALSDAKDSLGLAPAVTGISLLSGAGRLTGRVKTVQLAAGVPDATAPKVHLCARAIVAATSETVIVVSHPGVDAGGWGGVLSTGACEAGVRGVIVDGPTRDLDEARTLKFPLFARGTTARTARGRVYEESTGKPVFIDGQEVRDGDYVLGDGTAIVFVAQDSAEVIIATAERIARKEAAMVAALRAGDPITAVMGADYENMLETNHG